MHEEVPTDCLFGPYRSPPDRPCAEPAPREEIVFGWALICLGGLRVAVALVAGEVWGAEATIAALMVPWGIRMLVAR